MALVAYVCVWVRAREHVGFSFEIPEATQLSRTTPQSSISVFIHGSGASVFCCRVHFHRGQLLRSHGLFHQHL